MSLPEKLKQLCATAMNQKRGSLITGVVFGMIACVFTLYLIFSGPCNAKADKPEQASAKNPAATSASVRVDTTKACRGCAHLSASYPGTVKASQSTKLTFRVGGPIVEVLVKPGDHVKKGQVLMRIDPRDYQSQVKATQSALDAAQAKLTAMERGARAEDINVLEAQIAAADARRDFAHEQFERYKRLVKKNAISKSQFDSAQSELLAAEASFRALKEQLVKAKAGARDEDIQAMKAEIRGLQTKLQVAEDALADTYLRAPFDGTITKQFFEAHEMVGDSKVVMAMHDISTLEISTSLPERELVRRDIEKPFPVRVRFHATGDRQFDAVFSEIDTEANSQTRTYAATFRMKAPKDVRILPGMTAEVLVPSQAAEGDVISVPLTAIVSDADGKDYVWVVKPDQTAEQRPIVRGKILQGNQCEVIEGLSGDEEVVTLGSRFVHRGVKLKKTEDANHK
ncbi:MAG: efflux RND transporter periplasmic adaptor subunit [Planctomycetia bacterium]|jgi:multidrug efflux pump subunit AcrA (membrane-fusion protein)